MKVEKIRGFRDQYPEDMGPRKQMLGLAEERAEKFGFQKIDVPSLESMDLYRIKSGDELVSQTYSFVDKGGREVTMIPEFTPSVVRMLTARKDIPKPVRWYGTPKLWRYEEPQAGRLREHIQFNADIFGVNSPEADAELIGLAASILDSLGLNNEYEIRVSNREITEKLLSGMGAKDIRQAFAAIDRYRKVSKEDFLNEIIKSGVEEKNAGFLYDLISEPFDIAELSARMSALPNEFQVDVALIERMMYTGRLVKTYTNSGVKYDLSIVRGLSYYTGIVFEAFDVGGEFRSILGGGRYDNLAKLLSDQDIPAVGFGMGDAVIELLMKRAGKWHVAKEEDSYYLASLLKEDREYAFKVANSTRKYNEVIIDISDRGLSSQMKAASLRGCRYTIIIGEKERASESLTVRDMSTGEQRIVPLSEFLDSLASRS